MAERVKARLETEYCRAELALPIPNSPTLSVCLILPQKLNIFKEIYAY